MNKILILLVIFFASTCFADHKQEKATSLTVEIKGVDSYISDVLNKSLTIKRSIHEHKLSSSRVQNIYSTSESQIIDILQSLGYFNSSVSSTLESINNTWHAKYNINAGKPTLIKEINIVLLGEGRNNKHLNKQFNTLKVKKNDVITTANYEDSKQELLGIAYDFGYLNAKITKSSLEIDRANNIAKIFITLDTDKQYYLSTVRFEGSKHSTKILDRFVSNKKSIKYTQEVINELHSDLENINLFNKIRIDPKPKLDNDNDYNVPLVVRLKDKPLDRFTGSVGYGTDTKTRGSLGWQHTRLKFPGHKFSANASYSGIKKQLATNYVIPGKHPVNDKYFISLSGSEEQVDEKLSRKGELSFAKNKKSHNFNSTFAFDYLVENFKLLQSTELTKKQYLLPSSKFIWLRPKNEHNNISKRFGLSIRTGLDLVSSTNLIQIEVDTKIIFPLTDKTKLITRGDFGYTISKSFDDVPFSLRYFAGGDKSVRGFAYHSLGPTKTDTNGKKSVVGGKYLATASLELEQEIKEKISAAVFVDTGNAMNHWHTNLPVSVGTGLRFATPIGSLRLDIAKQISQIKSKNLRIHLTFGTDL